MTEREAPINVVELQRKCMYFFKNSPLSITINVNGLNSSIRISKLQNDSVMSFTYRFKMHQQYHFLCMDMFVCSNRTVKNTPNSREWCPQTAGERTDLDKGTNGMST